MATAFAKIAFTASVKAAQSLYGSREAYARFEHGNDSGHELTPREAEFIHMRDSFYQATVSETGWPYVQFRGGPTGFLKVLDAKTLGYADFRGNRQYLSVGNIKATTVRIVHQDERHAAIGINIADTQILTVAAEVGIA